MKMNFVPELEMFEDKQKTWILKTRQSVNFHKQKLWSLNESFQIMNAYLKPYKCLKRLLTNNVT